MSKLTDLTLSAARDGLQNKDFTATELTKAHIERAEAATKLNAMILATPEKALEMAAASDEKLAQGSGGALEGVPIGVKDLFCTKACAQQLVLKFLANLHRPMKAP